MITLALDTSSARGSLALLDDDAVTVERTFGRGELFPVLAGLAVEVRAVDLFAVGLGPGSFTGIRAGIAAAIGLAFPHRRPLQGAGSYDALALDACAGMPPDCAQLVVLGDARRDEIYYAIYDRDGRREQDLQLAPLEALADAVHHPLWFVGTDINRYRDALRSLLGGFAVVAEQPFYPRAGAVGRLARREFLAAGRQGVARLEPLYLRPLAYARR